MDSIGSVKVDLGANKTQISQRMNKANQEKSETEYQDSIAKNIHDSFENGVARVIITSQKLEELAKLKEKLGENSNNKIQEDLPIINGFAAEIDEKTAQEILPDIFKSNNQASIFVDQEIKFIDLLDKNNSKQTGEAPTVNVVLETMNIHKFHEKGIKGQGETICIIDSGIAPHPDFKGKIKHFEDLVSQRTEPYDDLGHGTHCAGIALGVAPQAEIVAVKVANNNAKENTSRLIKGMQWVLENKDKYDITVVNISMGSIPEGPYKDDPLAQAAAKLVEAELQVYCSAGNFGIGGEISTPGYSPDVCTVGASDDHKTVDRSDDTVAPFSSRGPTPFDKLPKPDFIFPGSNIKSTGTNNDYVVQSGTSMAAPGAAGIGALLNQVTKHTVKFARIKEVLKETADKLPKFKENAQGAGVIDAVEAAEKLTGKPFSEITA